MNEMEWNIKPDRSADHPAYTGATCSTIALVVGVD